MLVENTYFTPQTYVQFINFMASNSALIANNPQL